MSNIAEVIGWKFNHQLGMRCKEVDGALTIVEFPGGVPSKADQAKWAGEYAAWEKAGGKKDIEAQEMLNNPVIESLIDEILSILTAGGMALPDNVKNNIKDRIKTKL